MTGSKQTNGQVSTSEDGSAKLITLGRVGKTHGIKGWLKLYSYTDPVTNITDFDRFMVAKSTDRSGLGASAGGKPLPAELQVDQIQVRNDRLLVHFIGYDDPETAGTLVGCQLQVLADRLPELDAEEYYWHQLIGLRVINGDGQWLGNVDQLLETGANDVVVVRPCAGSLDDRERLIPYLRDSVITRVDLDAGELKVDWRADFLL